MDTILDKLTAIETAAGRIMDAAESEKKELDAEYKKKRAAFDAEVDRETDSKLKDLEDQLTKERNSHLEVLRQDAGQRLDRLDRIYSSDHTHLAEEIFRQVTKA
ncbi:MAG: hypothetical protein U0L49_06425 [Eubacterium sp.]|nr:hypothetical protein [Eubacterium sp.]